jgi:single-strand DNA-binding protein
MYSLRNKIQLIGHAGITPELKTTENGKQYTRFSIATNESYRNAKGEKVTETQWHQVVAWGKIATLAAQYVQKGNEIAVEGKLMYREYTDNQNVKRQVSEIQLNELLLLGKKDVE